jgi:hypothetical protein
MRMCGSRLEMDERKTDSTTPVPAALARHAAAEWRRLRRAWAAARAGEAAAARRVRIATRRLREDLAVAARAGASPGRRGAEPPGVRQVARARRALGHLRRALGPSRESAVSLATFDDASARHVWRAPLVAPVRRGIARAADRRRATLGTSMSACDRRALDRRVTAAIGVLAATPPVAADAALAAHLLHRTREAHRAAARCGTLYDPERLHGLRIAVKKLRYAVEAGAAAGLAVAPAMTALADLQRRLGRLQDIQVLQQTVQAALARPRGAPPGAAGAVVLDALERDGRWLHAEIVGDLGGLGVVLAEVRGAVVRRTTARPPAARAAAGVARRAAAVGRDGTSDAAPALDAIGYR